ncbi:MAG: winged helix-turn-helix domain-containing protein [Minicystis sp.]
MGTVGAGKRVERWDENRRFRALKLHEQGWLQIEIAEALGVTKSAVCQWLSRARREGAEALHNHMPPGPTPRLTEAQRAQLPALLQRGAEAFGFTGDIWTTPRVAEVIRREFGVSYHRAHISKVLRDIGWSLQKPARRAIQRNEKAIEQWRHERWPDLKKSF